MQPISQRIKGILPVIAAVFCLATAGYVTAQVKSKASASVTLSTAKDQIIHKEVCQECSDEAKSSWWQRNKVIVLRVGVVAVVAAVTLYLGYKYLNRAPSIAPATEWHETMPGDPNYMSRLEIEKDALFNTYDQGCQIDPEAQAQLDLIDRVDELKNLAAQENLARKANAEYVKNSEIDARRAASLAQANAKRKAEGMLTKSEIARVQAETQAALEAADSAAQQAREEWRNSAVDANYMSRQEIDADAAHATGIAQGVAFAKQQAQDYRDGMADRVAKLYEPIKSWLFGQIEFSAAQESLNKKIELEADIQDVIKRHQ